MLCVLIIYTALSLQILSNLANDLGDGIRGTDRNRHHDSPARLVRSGAVSAGRFRAWLVLWLTQTMMADLVKPFNSLPNRAVFWLGGGVDFRSLGLHHGQKNLMVTMHLVSLPF